MANVADAIKKISSNFALIRLASKYKPLWVAILF